jgi:starch phosphorylase
VVISEASQTLASLAYNFRWAWHRPTADVFGVLAPDVWDMTHNPVAVLRAVEDAPDVLARHAAQLADAGADLGSYLDATPSDVHAPRVAYFSAEFAIAECLPIYSGGLGVLAGDHLKSASDLGLPLMGVGLLYRYGYFQQIIDATGQQRETYDRLDPETLPLRTVFATDGVPLEIGVPFPGRTVLARVWLAQVGRVRLYLLDTDLPRNREDDRWITGHLYGGDIDTRLRQEIVLGIGGARLVEALRLLGLEVAPEVYHLNEGHSAFAAVERAAERMRTVPGGNFFVAHDTVAERVAFTTHTPVAAGHDVFPAELIEAYLADYRHQLGLTHAQFMALGRRDPGDTAEQFNMTVLALRSAHARNAVSQLHGKVSRRLWSEIGVGHASAPPHIEMESITNGVHTATWAGPEMSAFLDRYADISWCSAPHHTEAWAPLAAADLRALWAARNAQRARLIERIERSSQRDSASGLCSQIAAERPLVIGFARRFATYKRAGLLLQEPERLARLLSNSARPVVLVFAGKAHPHDEAGKLLIRRIVEASRAAQFRGRIIFLANYDVELARLLVQGSDVWLNTPRRPLEASGTSGMKATLNGALHISELDGWWAEAYAPGLGWALGEGIPDDATEAVRDRAEAGQLMDLLEYRIVPLFFARDAHGLPTAWLERVQSSVRALGGVFSAHRMLKDYADRIYRPLTRRGAIPLAFEEAPRRDALAA